MPDPSAPAVTEDWTQFDPGAYLDEYYGDIGSENLELLRFLAEISAVTRVDEIHFSDYLEANLEEVRRWISAEPTAFDWDAFIRKALELETATPCTDAEVAHRANEIRERVTRLMRCDASRAPPIEYLHQPYDVLLTNFCAESATSEWKQWRTYMANILSVLKPGGWLVISALKGATRYSVGSQSFPAVDISEHELIELLEENGFPRKGIKVRCAPADRPTREYNGLMLAVAEKASTPTRGAA
jgi:hypothetical protein